MAQLAILGHPTRGNEVIKILEMLGGKTHRGRFTGREISCGYYIKADGYMGFKYYSLFYDTTVFTLEEFLEKFPYKTGDTVFVEGKECLIEDVIWHNELNCIRYKVFHTTGSLINGWYYVCNLQPYKEETMEEKKECWRYEATSCRSVRNENRQMFSRLERN